MEHTFPGSVVVAAVVGGLFVALVAAYSVKAATAGRLAHSRLTRLGSSPLLGRWLLEAGYWLVLAPGRACAALGIRPDWITWASLVLSLATLPLAASGYLAAAGALFLFASALDALDGIVARQTGTASDAGEVLDAVVDRYADAAPLIGIAIYYRASVLEMAIPLAALMGSMMVSYNRAKSEAMRLDLAGGVMRRQERIVYIVVALVFGPAVPLITGKAGSADAWTLGWVAFIAVLANIEALRLARAARRALVAQAGATTASMATAPSAPTAATSAPTAARDARASGPQTGRGARIVTPIPGPKSQALRAREDKHIAPGFQAIAAHAGIAIDHGKGSELFDVDGNRFLDLAAGIGVAALGYAHPEYVAALEAQLEKSHVGSLTTEARVRALEALAAVAPAGLTRAQLYSGGSEAVESAMRLAKAFTGKSEVLSFWGGFHGKTAAALAQMGSTFKHGLGPLVPGAYLTPYADCAFCPFKLTHPTCGLLCVEFAEQKLERETTGRLAAIIVEPMQGTAGNIVPPPDFLPAVADLAKRRGALLIADEMITGFGRTGKMFAVHHTGVQPDIMTCGKALGGGFPVSAVLVKDEIAQAKPWSTPSFSSSSYGGNPLAGAAIAASMDIIGRHQLDANAKSVGAQLKTGLEDIARRHPVVRNVRGEGLLLGFDLLDGDGKPWSAPKCREVFGALLRRGVVSMAYTARVRVNPPLVFTAGEAAEALELIDATLTELRV